jgi:hypothetical protein
VAETICALLRALGVAKGCTSTSTTLDQMVLDVRRDITTVIVDGLPQTETLSEALKSKVDAAPHPVPPPPPRRRRGPCTPPPPPPLSVP